jgi:hypothetical protein
MEREKREKDTLPQDIMVLAKKRKRKTGNEGKTPATSLQNQQKRAQRSKSNSIDN